MAIKNRFLKAGILWLLAAAAFTASALLQEDHTGLRLIPAGFAAAVGILNLMRHKTA